jgi:hypothetical protein
MATASELDPLTLRAMAQQLDDVRDTALGVTRPTVEAKAVAGFCSGMAARYRSVAIEIEQARAAAAKRVAQAMRATTVELPIVVTADEVPRVLRGLGAGAQIERVPRSTVTGRRPDRRNVGPA